MGQRGQGLWPGELGLGARALGLITPNWHTAESLLSPPLIPEDEGPSRRTVISWKGPLGRWMVDPDGWGPLTKHAGLVRSVSIPCVYSHVASLLVNFYPSTDSAALAG
ncbi:hypothetical protein GX48_07804 [Paracoccidioides brasiliensis]|nr:hypothetical protein GX48_07804 [Paracoccidioides brasiliensis]